MEEGQFQLAIDARYKFIAYLKKTHTVDHQMRRAYLELVMLSLVKTGSTKSRVNTLIDKMISEFTKDTPNAMNQEEFRVSEGFKEAVQD